VLIAQKNGGKDVYGNLISPAEAVQIALQQVNGTVVKTELNT